jgi:lactoylglutathione lyase
MQLGAFSISLAVKDIHASQAFYAKLGFEAIGGQIEQNWLILRNPDKITIGLFQGMFERNMLTFNPGWDAECNNLESFTDVRGIQATLLAAGLTLDSQADATTTGPASVTLTDPDGNPILIDQHR